MTAREARGAAVSDRVEALLALDPLSRAGAQELAARRGEVLRLVEDLAVAGPLGPGSIESACELGLQLELALEVLGEPPRGGAGVPGRQEIVARLLQLARDGGNRVYEIELLLRQAELWREDGEAAPAARLYEAALVTARGAELGPLEAAALAGLAEVAKEQGNLFKAHMLYGKQRALSEAIGDPQIGAQAAANQAATALGLADYRRAARYAREAHGLYWGLSDEQGAAEALCNLGLAQKHLEQPAASRRSYHRALRLLQGLGNEALEAAVCYNLAGLVLGGEDELAGCLLQRAAVLAEKVGAVVLRDAALRAAALLPEQARSPLPEAGAARVLDFVRQDPDIS